MSTKYAVNVTVGVGFMRANVPEDLPASLKMQIAEDVQQLIQQAVHRFYEGQAS